MSCRFGSAAVGSGGRGTSFCHGKTGCFGGGVRYSFIHSFTSTMSTMQLDINNRHFRDLVGATSSRRDEILSVFCRQPCSEANKILEITIPSSLPCLRSGVVPAAGEFVVNEARKHSESTTGRPFFQWEDDGSRDGPKRRITKRGLKM